MEKDYQQSFVERVMHSTGLHHSYYQAPPSTQKYCQIELRSLVDHSNYRGLARDPADQSEELML